MDSSCNSVFLCYLVYQQHFSSYTTRRPAPADRTARRQFQASGQPVSRTERRLVTQWRHGCRAKRRSVCNAGASNRGRSLCVQMSRQRSYPLPIYWYHSKGNWLCYNFAADSLYIMKLCSRLLVLYLVLLRYPKPTPKPRFFAKTAHRRNLGFFAIIDGFWAHLHVKII